MTLLGERKILVNQFHLEAYFQFKTWFKYRYINYQDQIKGEIADHVRIEKINFKK